MRADRLLALLLLLQARGKVTAAALAEELEVSLRTIYRDLQALANAGVPVFAESGPGGGCQLVAGYRSPLDALSREEADALLILGIPGPLRELGLGGLVDSAHQRVSQAAVPRPSATGPLVHLDLPRWFHPADETPHLVPLARAVRLCRRTEITYATTDEARTKTHRLEPLGLVNKAGVWYLVAATAKGTAVFRVGRIRGLEASEETFRRPPDFDLERFWATWSDEFAASRPRMAVTVRVSPRAVAVLPEVLGDAVRPSLATAEPPDGQGWRLVTLWFEHPQAAAHRLAGFADLIEVVTPIEVRDIVIDAAERTLRRYRSH